MNRVPPFPLSQPITGQCRISDLATKRIACTVLSAKMSSHDTWFDYHRRRINGQRRRADYFRAHSEYREQLF